MSDKLKKRPLFTKEKADILKKTLGRFDEDTAVDPLAFDESIEFTLKDRTFLLHVLIETLCYMLEADEYKRQELFNLVYQEFEGNKFADSVIGGPDLTRMRKDAALQFFEHIKQIHRSMSPLSNEHIYEVQETSIPISRVEKYHEAFDEIRTIAKGGFGTVCMARHKIDGGFYAVKKIIFVYRKDSDYVKVMREVRNLSSLSNKYVVAYNNAWVQPVSQQDLDSMKPDSENGYTEDTDASTYEQSLDSCVSFVDNSYNARRVSNCSESSSVVFQYDSNDSQSYLNINQSNSYISSSSSNTDKSQSKLPRLPLLNIKMMLCIQMEYCDYDLRHWLNERDAGRPLPFSKSVPDIFKEILCGVAYIHEKEIIHRDLKPQNIFYSKNKGVMKVGDFGLATLNRAPSDAEQGDLNHSTDLGTMPYAAPEQRFNSVYDSKVDMYSLGIILIELLLKFVTTSEFVDVIDDFKLGFVPEEIQQNWPEYIPLLKNLLQEDNDHRMTAKQVLDMPLFQDKQIETSYLEQKVEDLERELAEKEQEFQERERALTQKLQAIEEALISKEQILQQISEEVKLLKEYINNINRLQ